MEDATESALPFVNEVSLRGTAADSSGFQGLHGLGIRHGYFDSGGDGSGTSDHGEDREEHACMVVDLSEDDSFVTCQDRFEKLQPMIAIGQHATRDDSDESLERTGKCRLPSRSLEMVVHTVVPPTDLTDTALHVAIDRRLSSQTIIRRAWEERVIRQRMRALLRELIARSEEKRPCVAMERLVRGRSSSARGRGERRNRPVHEGVDADHPGTCRHDAPLHDRVQAGLR